MTALCGTHYRGLQQFAMPQRGGRVLDATEARQSEARGAITAVLARAGLAAIDARPEMEALTGGVSSDIWRVTLEGRSVCVKRALAKLKVRADWRAPIERSRFEADWLARAARIVPEAVPAVLHYDRSAGALVMPYLEPGRHRLWKEALRDGDADPGVAAQVGDRLVRIHRATALDPVVAAAFPTDSIFQAIRLEPYLLATAERHPDLKSQLARLARRTASTKLALVHGDVSPKNILIGPDGPLFIDAECAWYGDPAFDLAFCLNHLLLKCLWTPQAAEGFLACFDALVEAYMQGVVWEPRRVFEGRVAALLPGLFLARVDGKSPVEYITQEADREKVRRVAILFLLGPAATLSEMRSAWGAEIGL